MFSGPTQRIGDGYIVLRHAVSPAAVRAALRLLNLEIRRRGLTADEIAACQETTFFPHLRWEPEISALLPAAAAEMLPAGEWAEPQILLRFPDELQSWTITPHVDEPPAWAEGRQYAAIVGVALTPTREGGGGVCVWPTAGAGGPAVVPLAAGDAIVMQPTLRHAGTLNLGERIRYAVYFRLLA